MVNIERKTITIILIAVIISTLINVGILFITFKPWLDFDPDLTDPVNVQAQIRVDFFDGPTQFIPLTLFDIDIVNNKTTRINAQYYYFEITDLNLTMAGFSFIYLQWIVDEEAWDKFPEMNGHWKIEDNEGSVRRNSGDFARDILTGSIYIAEIDVTKYMNRDVPPSIIDMELNLFNRLP